MYAMSKIKTNYAYVNFLGYFAQNKEKNCYVTE